jgi:hypothetical protein
VQNDPVNYVDPTGLQEVIVGPCPAGQCVVTVYGSVGGLFGGGGGSLGSTLHPPLLDGPELSPDGGGGGGGGAPVPVQNNAPQQNDCQRFASIVERIANETIGLRPDIPGLDVQLFMNRMATTFTEFPSATLPAVIGLEGRSRPAMTFGSSGFARPYFEPDIIVNIVLDEIEKGFARPYFEPDANQVRHAVGGLIAGYVGIPLDDPVFGLGMNNRENPADPVHGVPDINLNNQTVPMGRRLAMNANSLAVRGPVGAAAARALADWIRNTFCEG